MKDTAIRFEEKIAEDPTTGCWCWLADSYKGYGRFKFLGKKWWAHRFSYEMYVGKIPDSAVLDHLCRNPSCVNPDHLEPVTIRENNRRGANCYLSGLRDRPKTCKLGHGITEDNIMIRRRSLVDRTRVSYLCKKCNG